MDFSELIEFLDLKKKDIIVTIINPVRKEDYYKQGRMTGFKAGLFGGGRSRYKNGYPHSFESSKMHWIKKPRVQVVYSVFDYGKSEHSDWVDVDNCTFEIKEIK